MTLHDLLDDAVREEPPLVVDASAAWAQGRARRRHLPRALAAAVAVLGLLALVVPIVPVPAGGVASPSAATGYPDRLRQPWTLDAMPDRPGPVAAVVLWPDRTWSSRLRDLLPGATEGAEGHVLQLVAPQGRVWRGPAGLGEVTLSPDGTRLVGLRGVDGALVVHDLAAGTRTVVEGVAAQRAGVAGVAAVPELSPPRWSPDGRSVAWAAGHALVVDVVTGTVRRVPPAGRFAGWRSPSELVFLDRETQEAVITDLAGAERSRVRLAGLPAPDVRLTEEALVAGDGRTLVVPDGFGLRWHDLETGRLQVSWRYPVEDGGAVCGLGPFAVAGSPDVVVTTHDAAGRGARAVRMGPRAGVAYDAQATPVTCPVWASQALAGPRFVDAGPPVGLQVLAGGVSLVVALALVTRLARRRT